MKTNSSTPDITRSRVMYMAHHLYRNRVNPSNTWSQIVEYAWYFIHFREALKKGVVQFSYFKQDRTIREARGTLNPTLIPYDKLPKGKPIEVDERPNYKSIPYYDLDRCEWRAFSITNFIGFVEVFRLAPGKIKE